MMDGSGLPTKRSTCPYCGVGCGVKLTPDGAGGLRVKGDAEHPANFGRLCSKGSALGDTVALGHRLATPMVDGAPAPWDTALQTVADRFSAAIREHGPDSVAFYVSGQLLTEDYYVANKLMKGFIGSANIDTNSRLCMASTVAGHKRAFGTDTVPGTYEDLDQADLIVLVGSNLAWCHPVLYQRVKASGARIIVVDPRRTASCDGAALHLALEPGSDVALFNHLLAQIAERGALDGAYLAQTNGCDAAVQAAQADDIAVTGLDPVEVAQFCDMWIGTEKVVTIFSQGVNQSTSGVDKVNAILNCHLATGRIGRPGLGPFSVTGQPNAMGGREVGGLANMLACHLDLENPAHRAAVQAFWDAPKMPSAPGLKAIDMFRAVADGRIKALWIIHTNPAVTLPDADGVRDAIAGCDFIVVSDITGQTDSARLADIVLPASAWAEKEGTVTNSDRTISRQRAVLPSFGGSRPDWDILAEVGRRMGWAMAFDYQIPAEIYREHAALSGIAGGFGRDFDISAHRDISDSAYEDLAPFRWPLTDNRQGGRFFANGKVFHSDGKARLVPVTWRPPAEKRSPRFPFRLNTGRLRDQWHTMTRTGLAARLSSHMPEPQLDLHPEDAAELGIAGNDLAEIRSPLGRCILRAHLTHDVPRGQVFAPIHWTGETAPSARIDAVIPSAVDALSGQPESKAAVVAVTRFDAAWYGFAVAEDGLTLDCDYWALATTDTGQRAELAGATPIADWEGFARTVFGLPDADVISVTDLAVGRVRLAFHRNGVLRAALFIAPSPVAVMRDYLSTRPGAPTENVLLGQPPANIPDPGPVVCSCFGVGVNTILRAIESQHLVDVDQIGAALKAGTNCGSCRPELSDLLAKVGLRHAAE